MPVCRMRQFVFSTHCRRWRLWQTQCPSSRASCRPARIYGLSGMRCSIFLKTHFRFSLNSRKQVNIIFGKKKITKKEWYWLKVTVCLNALLCIMHYFFSPQLSLIVFQVYCQVIKQTNHVPQPNSPANRAHWHLLTCMSCTFLPSRAILRYLRFHLKRFVCVWIMNCFFLWCMQ